jgi:hypothetical protein
LLNYRRPSKSQIVEKALDWVKQNLSREERYRYQILQLQRENKKLLAQLMSVQERQENAPIPRHSKSTPTKSSSSVNTNLDINTSPVNAPINLNTNVPPSVALNNTSPIPNIYSTDFITHSNNNGWSNSNYQMMNTIPQTTSYHSNIELMNQDFSSRSDDEDNASSGNEDDIDYQSTPRNCSSNYIEHGTPLIQKQYIQQQHNMMAPELYCK